MVLNSCSSCASSNLATRYAQQLSEPLQSHLSASDGASVSGDLVAAASTPGGVTGAAAQNSVSGFNTQDGSLAKLINTSACTAG